MRILHLILFMMFSCSYWAGDGDSSTFSWAQPDFRDYIKALEQGLIRDATWVSRSNISLSTADYPITTQTYKLSWPLMSSTSSVHRWFTRTSVGTFATRTLGGTGVNYVSIVDSTPLVTAGRAAVSIYITGPHSIGDMIMVTAPAFSLGNIYSTSKTVTLTFTQ